MDMEQVSPDKVQQEYRDTGEAKGEPTLSHRPWHEWASSPEACNRPFRASDVTLATLSALQ